LLEKLTPTGFLDDHDVDPLVESFYILLFNLLLDILTDVVHN